MAPITLPCDELPFTIDNIPFGVVQRQDGRGGPRCATAIGSHALLLSEYAKSSGLLKAFPDIPFDVIFNKPVLNEFAGLRRATRKKVRELIQSDIRDQRIDEKCLIPLDDVIMCLPMHIGGFTDYLCSLEHCQNCSPTGQIHKSWYFAPSAYNGRASSVVPSPCPVNRPKGIFYKPDTGEPMYGACQALDYELEVGYFVSGEIQHGKTLDIDDAEDHIFGFVLLNDWSARDMQMFEMQPLGPFHGKGFGTSISPWIITMDALEPFRCSPTIKQDPVPFDHLRWKDDKTGTFDVNLRVTLRRQGKSYEMATSNLKYLYWTPFQQITHHASAMCGLAAGDLIGTGTISGDKVDPSGKKLELGCLYEVTERGARAFTLSDGTSAKYLEDGDEVILEGWCGDPNGKGPRLGFGQCKGKILPAQ